MKLESLRDLYVEQLQDLYNAEQQLIKALPKMARAASSEELKAAFEDHLGQTRQHAQRIETIFEQMGEKAKGKKCKAMEGLVEEGGEVIKEDMDDGIKDAALIAAAQRVGARRTFFTHLTHENTHAALAAKLPPGIEPAYDGLVIDLPGA